MTVRELRDLERQLDANDTELDQLMAAAEELVRKCGNLARLLAGGKRASVSAKSAVKNNKKKEKRR